MNVPVYLHSFEVPTNPANRVTYTDITVNTQADGYTHFDCSRVYSNYAELTKNNFGLSNRPATGDGTGEDQAVVFGADFGAGQFSMIMTRYQIFDYNQSTGRLRIMVAIVPTDKYKNEVLRVACYGGIKI